jgi:hypothetical protein
MRLHVVAVRMTSSGSWQADMTQKVEAHLNEKDLRQLSAVGVVYTNSIEVQPVTTHVKFVVRDDLNGNMGTVTARVPRMR